MRILFHAPGLAAFRPEIELQPLLGLQPTIAQSLSALQPNHRLTGNRGNIIHAEAPAKMLAREPRKSAYGNIAALQKQYGSSYAQIMAEHFDMIVISMANFIRPGHDGSTLAAALKGLKGRVPFIILGAGLQGSEPLSAQEPGNREVLAVMNSEAALFGVRGTKTANWLSENGFKNATVLGCPSLYVYPQSILSISGRSARAKGKTVNVMTAGHLSLHRGRIQERGRILVQALKGIRASYVFQDEFFGYGQISDRHFSYNEGSNMAAPVPLNRWFMSQHKLETSFNRYYYFTEAAAWRQASLQHDLFLGDRFHGGVAALQAGQPAIFLKHDNRVSELTEHFGLPNLTLDDFLEKGIEATLEEHLSDEALAKMRALYRQRHQEFSAALASHGLTVTSRLPPEKGGQSAGTDTAGIVTASSKLPPTATPAVSLSRLPNYILRRITPPGATKVVVSFEAADETINRKNPRRPGFGEAFLLKEGFAVLSVLCNQANWYRPEDFNKAIQTAEMQTWLQSFDTRIAYGSSMGGFAASTFAEAMGIDVVVALQPISSLAADLAPWEERFAPGRALDWSGAYRDGAEGLAKVRSVYALYDPKSPDKNHVSRLEAKAGNRLHHVRVPGAEHAVPRYLHARGLLKTTVIAAMNEAPAAEIEAILKNA